MTRKGASHFREKKRKFFGVLPFRTENWARVVEKEGGVRDVQDAEASGERAASSKAGVGNGADGGAEAVSTKKKKGGRKGARRERRRRVVFWGVLLAGAALAFGAADRGASQCFWRRWREARRAPSVRTVYAPTVVGFAPSSVVWTPSRAFAVARPLEATTVQRGYPSVPIASAPVCASVCGAESLAVAPPSETFGAISSSETSVCGAESLAVAPPSVATSVGYPAQEASVASVATGGAGVCAGVCGDVAACSGVCNPCDAASTATTCVETEYKEEEITTYETVWDCETRWRDKTTTRQVPETSIKRERVRVERPVWETVEKETTYDVTRYVPETSMQTRTRTTLRPVVETRERKILETVNQPVVETVFQQRRRVVNRPTTIYRTETRDYGTFETQIVAVPGRQRHCLRWRCGGDYYDPATGRTRCRLPGLYWTPTQEPTEYRAQKVYRPNLVATQVPVTVYRPETVVENVPTTRTMYRPVQVERTVFEPTTVYVRETRTELVPTTTCKPVKERVVKKTPTRALRMQTTEEIRETPTTTYKTVTEVVKEPYVARVARQVPKTTKVWRPVPVYKTVVPVATRYLSRPAASDAVSETVETVERVETFRNEAPSANVEEKRCCEPSVPSGGGGDAADFAPRLTSRTNGVADEADAGAAERRERTEETELARNSRLRTGTGTAESATGPELPSAVPNARRAARPSGGVENAPPVVSSSWDVASPTGNRSANGSANGAASETAAFEEAEAFEAAETPTAFEFAEEKETFVAPSNQASGGRDAASNLPTPTVAPTRATVERR